MVGEIAMHPADVFGAARDQRMGFGARVFADNSIEKRGRMSASRKGVGAYRNETSAKQTSEEFFLQRTRAVFSVGESPAKELQRS